MPSKPRVHDFVPQPRLREVDHVDVGASPAEAYQAARHFDLSRSKLIGTLFQMRLIPARLRGEEIPENAFSLDVIGTSGPGFHVLYDDPGRSFCIGAIGRFWESDITYLDIAPDKFAEFAEPGWGKVAWELRFEPLGETSTRIVLELRVTATDDDAWQKQRRYFRLIGPFSRFMRRHMLGILLRDLKSPEADEADRALPGDDRIKDPKGVATHGITIDAPPEAIWPWLVQMGCRRGGYYSYDLLDNEGTSSAREVVPDLQSLKEGDVLPATPESAGDFWVDRLEKPRFMMLHGLFDADAGRPVSPGEPRPKSYWEVSWAFVLEPLNANTTRLIVRARVDYEPERLVRRAIWMGLLHHFMETEQLHNLKLRAEGKLSRKHDSLVDIGEGILGALGMLADFGTPFLRGLRSHWGLTAEEAEREYPGDELIGEPRWGFTHGIEIDAPAASVWRWVAQIGQDKAGFYSYQWLENLAGCEVENASLVRKDWQTVKEGDEFKLHPRGPSMTVAEVVPGTYFVVTAGTEPPVPGSEAAEHPEGHVRVTWLFMVEELGPSRSRFISRYRVTYGDGVKTRLLYGPLLVEPVGFVMDRRMLLGVKERAEAERPSA